VVWAVLQGSERRGGCQHCSGELPQSSAVISVLVAMVVVIFIEAAVEVSWSTMAVFLVATLGDGGAVHSSSPTCAR
jgi:hypothetical protein